ncbi:MAG: hypothetical protein V4683_18930 [Bacteroidota bacterium]
MIVLDIFIGLVLVYFLYSLLVSLLAEMIATWLGMRARILRQGIDNLLNDKIPENLPKDVFKWLKDIFIVEPETFKYTNAGQFYKQPSVKHLAKVGENKWYSIRNTKPAYISKQNFANTMLNMLSNRGKGINEWEKIKFAIENNTLNLDPETIQMVKDWLSRANDKYENFSKLMLETYDEMMGRVNGWYKRKIGLMLFWLGFIVSIAFNVDTLQILETLRDNPKARTESVALAQKLVKEQTDSVKIEKGDSLKAHLKEHLLLIENQNNVIGAGWKFPEQTSTTQAKIRYIISKIVPSEKKFWGILITALALSLGAQFWFDLLKKLVAIRGAGVKPDEKEVNNTTDPNKINSDGLALSESNPVSIAISQNLKNWENIKGFVAANKISNSANNQAIEVIFEKDTVPDNFPQFIKIVLNNHEFEVPFVMKTGKKATLGQDNGTIQTGSIIQKFTDSRGTAAGIVLNKRTNKKAILTCAHVVRTDKTSFIDVNKAGIEMITKNNEQKPIGIVKNTVMSVFCDAGLVDLDSKAEELVNEIGIPTISQFRTVHSSEEGKTVITIKTLSGDQNGLLLNTGKYFTFDDQGSKDVRYFDLLVMGNHLNDFATAISQPGDSGSLIIDSSGIPIGILVGGTVINNQHFSFGIKLADVFDIMQIGTLNS